ncbi:Hsp20/alpha crystallin family protein [Meridianimarinicoccus sp. RP-17]|uniref:Hsp20/alpha crystallin family protein n=1 Tax=Meridianimarinicoccus zhengii TaxID=2056810 RepID=UPI0013A6E31A|nr:Hsp20/alpha crystallin family protein [Phycocomes zhengii]
MCATDTGDQNFWASLYADLRADADRLDGDLPKVKVFETDQAIVIRLDVPGFREEELSARVEDGFIHIEGKVAHAAGQGDERAERRQAERDDDRHDFVVRLPVSHGVTTDSLRMELSLGVLRVRIPVR